MPLGAPYDRREPPRRPGCRRFHHELSIFRQSRLRLCRLGYVSTSLTLEIQLVTTLDRAFGFGTGVAHCEAWSQLFSGEHHAPSPRKQSPCGRNEQVRVRLVSRRNSAHAPDQPQPDVCPVIRVCQPLARLLTPPPSWQAPGRPFPGKCTPGLASRGARPSTSSRPQTATAGTVYLLTDRISVAASPPSGRLASVILQPFISAICLTMASPSPVPPVAFAREASNR